MGAGNTAPDNLVNSQDFSKLKADFDEVVTAQLRKGNADAQPLPNWTLHDLRRTARSLGVYPLRSTLVES